MSIQVGDFVWIDPVPPATDVRRGICRFLGETSFAEGPWVGIELVGSVGKNSGSVFDKEYFQCLPQQGVFVRPELVRAFTATPLALPSPDLQSAGNIEMKLRIDIERLQDSLKTTQAELQSKKEACEVLEIDLEISKEQLLLAETELEELRVASSGRCSVEGAATSLSETIVALRRQLTLSEAEIAGLREEKLTLEEHLRAVQSSDKMLEQLTSRNLELDDEVTAAKQLLETTIANRDELQELLSLQDEELRLQRDQNTQLMSSLEKLEEDLERLRNTKAMESARLLEVIARLETQAAAATTNVPASPSLSTVAEELIVRRGAMAALSRLQEASAQRLHEAAIDWLNDDQMLKFLFDGETPVLRTSSAQHDFTVAFVRQCFETTERVAFDVCQTLLTMVEVCVADKDFSAGADSTGLLTQPCLLVAAVFDLALAADIVRAELAVLWAAFLTTPSVQVAGHAVCAAVAKSTLKIKERLAEVQASAICSSQRKSDMWLASIRSILDEIAVLRAALKVASNHAPPTAGSIAAVSCDRLCEVLVRAATTAALLLSSNDADLSSRLCSLADRLQQCHFLSLRYTISQPLLTQIWAALMLIFASAIYRTPEGAAECASALGKSRECFHQLYPRYPAEGEQDALLRSPTLLTATRSCCQNDGLSALLQLLAQPSEGNDADASGWGDMLDALASPIASTLTNVTEPPHEAQKELRMLYIDAVMDWACHCTATASSTEAVSDAPVANEVTEKAKQDLFKAEERVAALETELEQCKWSLWQAKAETDALSMVKADLQTLQHKLEAQEIAHQRRLRSVSDDYDAALAVMQQKAVALTQELREARRQELQRELSPMSIRERCEYEDTIRRLQQQLCSAMGATLNIDLRYFSSAERNQKNAGCPTAPVDVLPLPVICSFTSPSECRRARERVLLPQVVCK